ncbi:adenosine deaminase [Chlamydia trachomatis]|nr:adenosine deaminase [Chlamydia trachomatis]
MHCHLDGSLSMAAIRQLAEMATISIPVSDEELKACITASDHVENLEELLTKLQESYAPFL